MLLLEDHTNRIRSTGEKGKMYTKSCGWVDYEEMIFFTPFAFDMDGFRIIERDQP